MSVELFVFVYNPTTPFPFDFRLNCVAAIPVKSVEISSKIKFLSFGLEKSNALENALPEKKDDTLNWGSVDAIAGPYGGVEKYITSSMILKSPVWTVTAEPIVCPAATVPINERATSILFVDPIPTEITFKNSLLIFKMSDPDTELIPEETYIAVDPIPTDVERPIVIFFWWTALWIILSIEIITFSFWFLKLNDWVPEPTDVKSKGDEIAVGTPQSWKLFTSILRTKTFDGKVVPGAWNVAAIPIEVPAPEL